MTEIDVQVPLILKIWIADSWSLERELQSTPNANKPFVYLSCVVSEQEEKVGMNIYFVLHET